MALRIETLIAIVLLVYLLGVLVFIINIIKFFLGLP